MPGQNTIKQTDVYVDRLTDNAVYDALQHIVSETKKTVEKLSVRPVFLESDLQTPFNEPEENVKTLFSENSVVMLNFSITTSDGITISLRRLMVSEREWKPHDTASISCSRESRIGINEFARVLAAVRWNFSPIDRIAVLEHLTEDQKQYVEQRQASIHRLESMQDEFFKKIQDFTIQQATTAQENQAKLEESFNKRALELDASNAAIRKKLDKERATFEEEKRKLDLRDSTVVRRSIRDEVKSLLKSRADGFKLSKNASAKTLLVMIAYGVLLLVEFIVLTGSFLGFAAGDEVAVTATSWLIGRQIVFALAFTVTAGFFIRWLNSNAQRHVDEEFQTKKYELDFERASFVVEWAIEWAKEQNEVPQFLIERLSRGLFESSKSDVGPATAADAVASALFGSAAGAKLKLGENEISLDRTGIKRLMRNTNGE